MSAAVFTVRRRDLAWATALIVLLSTVWVARGDLADAGTDPPGEGIARVYIAVGTGFADALGVGPGAAAHGAPIILVPTDPPLDLATEAELIRLDPKVVIIVGGTGVVSDSMRATLEALLPNAVVERIAGTNRYKTNASFSAETFPIEGWVSVPAVGFTADHPASDISLFNFSRGYNDTDGALYAPINLPQGAEILEIKIQYHDADGDAGLFAYLLRYDGATGDLAEIAAAFSGGATGNGSVASTDIYGPDIVDNENYGYVINVVSTSSTEYISTVMVRYRLGASSG